jgi:hypothetical protein
LAVTSEVAKPAKLAAGVWGWGRRRRRRMTKPSGHPSRWQLAAAAAAEAAT